MWYAHRKLLENLFSFFFVIFKNMETDISTRIFSYKFINELKFSPF